MVKIEPGIIEKLFKDPLYIKRKEVESRLRKSEDEFRLAFENAKDAIFWADPKTAIIINCNKAAEMLLERKKKRK